ncbi:MAG: PKD domain-containing protein [Bacteroidota bacterium]
MHPKILVSFLLYIILNVPLHGQCDQPNAQFEFPLGETRFCEGGNVVIDNKTDEENPVSCVDFMRLDWGDGEVKEFSDFNNKEHTYDIEDSIACSTDLPVKYDIKLTVFYTNGLSNSITKEVTIYPMPVARFTAPSPICINMPTICLGNLSCWDSMWMWNIYPFPNGGDTISYDTDSLCHTFDELGPHTIQLIAINECPVDFSLQKDTLEQIVEVIDTIEAIATTSELIGCDSLVVIAQDNSDMPPTVIASERRWIIDPPGGWVFINGTSDTSQTAEIKFFEIGDFTIELEVVSSCNTDRKIIGQVKIIGPPSAGIDGVVGGCFPHSFSPVAVNINEGNSDNLVLTWNFPNGTPSTATGASPGTVFYNSPLTDTVTLTVANECDTVVYSRVITISENAMTDVEVQGMPGDGCAPFVLTFENNSTGGNPFWTVVPDDPGAWEFTNGTNAFSQNPEILFLQAGDYYVQMSLQYVQCGSDSTWTSDIIAVKTKPMLVINELVDGCTGTGEFSAVIESAGGFATSEVEVIWDFGQGTPQTFTGLNPPTVAFPEGTHEVTLTASNTCGDSTWTFEYEVVELAQANVTVDTSGTTNSCTPFQVDFINESIGATDDYIWKVSPDIPGAYAFLSGGTNTQNITLEFYEAGNYEVKLTVPNDCGDAVWIDSFVVYSAPIAVIATIPDSQCVNAEIQPFSNAVSLGSDPGATVEWLFPGGIPASSDEIDPGTIVYPDSGTFMITLVVSNRCDTDTATTSFHLSELSEIVFNLPDTVCKNDLPFVIDVTPGGGECSGSPALTNCHFNPALAINGWNYITYTRGTGNCKVELTDSIYVFFEEVSAGLDEEFCDTLLAPFYLLGASPVNGIWTKGKGLLDPFGLYSVAKAGFGVDTLTFTFHFNGCVFSATKLITIHRPPDAETDLVPNKGCKMESIEFSIDPSGLDSAIWDFGDNNPQVVDFTVEHTYQDTGTYEVTLIVVNPAKCRDTLVSVIEIIQPAEASFSIDPAIGCAPVIASFYNETEGEYTDCFWDFDNGETSNLCAPDDVTFTQGPTVVEYYPTLSVTNLCGTTTYSDTVTVLPNPQPAFEISLDTICSGETVSFQNNSAGDPYQYTWRDGLGNTYEGLELPAQSYFTDSLFATYYITLIATNDCGTDSVTRPLVVKPIDIEAFFNLDNSTFCQYEEIQITNGATPGSTVFYDLGDQNTSTDPNPAHVYQDTGTFRIIQYATTGCGFDTVHQKVKILPAPVIAMFLPDETCEQAEIEFSSTIDIPAPICFWEFGDGAANMACQTTHSYQEFGTFMVKLTVTDPLTGCSAIDSNEVLVRPNPVASASTLDTVGCGQVMATFQNENDSPGYTHVWTFPNGTSTDVHPSWKFETPDTYSVTLLTTDVHGCFDDTTFNQIITVHPVPNALFDLDISESCELPATVSTVNQSTGALDYQWIFSNGLESDFPDTTIVLNEPGMYEVELIASNEFQCPDTFNLPFNIYPELFANYDLLDDTLCAGTSVLIENLSINADNYTWIFSNGATVSGEIPDYSFPDPGTYTITLVAALDTVCADTANIMFEVEVHPTPIAGFIVVDTMLYDLCDGTIVCWDESIGASEYYYDFGDGHFSTEPNPVHRYYSIGEKMIIQIVSNEWGCMDTDTARFSPKYFDGLYIPTAFMPDISNEEYSLFQPKGVNLKEFVIEVFSPMGERVWFSNGLTDEGEPRDAWNGNNDKGQPYPQGAYVWKVAARFLNEQKWEGQNLEGGKVQIIGSVNLYR